jgi:PKD repeat protein
MVDFLLCTKVALRALVRAPRLLAIWLLLAAPAYAGTLSLAWDPVPSTLVAGYTVHYGPSEGNYPNTVDVGNVTTATIGNLTEGATYHFVVTAYDAAHIEGAPSNDVAATIAYAAPAAKFQASTVSGVAPLSLNFVNQSTGTITSYSWTFGDGTTSTSQNPAKVYSNPGTYTVQLTVNGPGGTNSLTKSNYINVTAQADTTPPAAPASLTATATSSTAINLGWSASTDNVGVTGYRVERCQGSGCTSFAQISTSTTASFGDTGLAAGTTYRYRVRATDAAGNLGAYSPIATATTTAAPDTTAPTAPGSLGATASGSTAINLSWSTSTDNVGVTGYSIERCQGSGCTSFAQVATSTTTSFANTGLAAGTTYRYRVRATDAAGNLGGYSPIATATTASAADTTPPTAPGSLGATANGSSAINLTWSVSIDDVAVTGYRIERCQGSGCTSFAQIATSTATTLADTALAAGTTYRYRVRATDAAGNLGPYSPIATATTVATADTTPPTAPPSLNASVDGSTAINLSWSTSSDNVGVTGYRIERCQGTGCTGFTQVATSTVTRYINSGLNAGTTYRYRVRASDAAGNLSAYSGIATVTTGTASGVPIPTAPIAFVQLNYATPQPPQSSVSVTYKSAQVAGNLNVVVVGWSDTNAEVTSVTDSMGNVYTRAVGPTTYSKDLSQSIYYAKNIAGAGASSNVVTVKFSKPAKWPDIRIVEYSGIDRTNPVDVVAVGSGGAMTSATSSVTTTSPNTLLFAANTVSTLTAGAGSGFTNRVITQPDGDIVMDRFATSVGSYSATAPVYYGVWVIQMVAFKGMK